MERVDKKMAQPNWFRVCVGCGKVLHKKELLRIVKLKNKQPEIDSRQIKPGRGAYVCPQKECILLARENYGLEKSLHIEIDRSFYNRLIKEVNKIEH